MSDRRQSILDAALSVFVEKGYSSATIADIRRASGATTGSIYHFFGGKPDIAVEIWKTANTEWEKIAISKRSSETPKEMIQTVVLGLAEWALQDRALFLFYEEMRIRALTDPELVEILTVSKQGFEEAEKVYQSWVDMGAVRDLPWPLASALIVGPTYDYLRKCGGIEQPEANAIHLAESAWDIVRQS
jgi:AcrR family transcriptional regulator